MNLEPDLSAIVVSYNSGPELRRCLDSVRREAQREGITAEVLVVDNASVDGCADDLSGDGISVLRNSTNRGFGAAANQGFRAARADRVLLLNPDARLTEGSLGSLMRELDASPQHALAAPTLRLRDGSRQESPRRFYTVSSLLAQRTPFARTAAGQRAKAAHLQHDEVASSVDWVTGAAMLLDRRAVAEQGPFDERFFLYFEDVDLCRRLAGSGRAVRFVPEAIVEHDHQRGSRAHVPWNKLLRQHVLSGLLYAARWSPTWWSMRSWRSAAVRLARAGARFALLFALGASLGLAPALVGLAAAIILVLLPSRRSLVAGAGPALAPGRTAIASSVATLGATGAGRLAALPPPAPPDLALFAAGAFVLLLLSQAISRRALSAARRRGLLWRTCIVAGPPDHAQALSSALKDNPEEGLSVLGYVPLDPLCADGPTPRLRDWAHVSEVAADLRADVVLLCGSPDELARMAAGVVALREASVDAAFVLSGNSELLQEEAPATLAGLPVLSLGSGADARLLGRARLVVERGAALLLVLLVGPLVLGLAGMGRALFGGSAFVPTERIGQHGRRFAMWRLRSGPGGDQGGGWLGGLMRRVHLDELPQLWNVVRGEMSLVGPRPVTPEIYESLADWERARFLVRPGITGMWQLDRLRRWRLEQMIVSDLLYLLRWSPSLDLRILARTFLGR